MKGKGESRGKFWPAAALALWLGLCLALAWWLLARA